MSPKLPQVSGDALVRALKRAGWEEVRQRGSHVMLSHPTRPGLLVVPIHRGRTVKTGILADILRDAGLSPDDLWRLL